MTPSTPNSKKREEKNFYRLTVSRSLSTVKASPPQSYFLIPVSAIDEDHQEGDEDWEEHHFPLNRIKSIVEHQAPPFTRLKTLRIQCAHQQRPPNVPYQVLRYFLEGSPNAEDKFVKLEMLAD
ncbi:unnamed protein product [Linum tenue]|uniref:Uncharacterized protein n=1 Tax=Linum tenue TaxID=586396 RepID=A0AAV0M101_9ROSI|nr:unnamed protein product [Linum tenue]